MVASMESYLIENKSWIEKQLNVVIDREKTPENLANSIYYSLLAGGKRLRPILLFASFDTFAQDGVDRNKTLHTAAALEMIHSYSLIHDDLPAMDDDDYRRGNLTNHKKFDEATAILAGDALLTDSFYLIMNDSLLSAEEKVFIAEALSFASGSTGMVGGQILDMEGENRSLQLHELEKIHELKTGRLIEFAILAGAYLAKGNDIHNQALKQFAYYLGLIFQVQDDILDVIGDEEKLGKPVGSDEGSDKSTYPNLLGLDGAIEKKASYVHLAEEALKIMDVGKSRLMDLLHHFANRDH